MSKLIDIILRENENNQRYRDGAKKMVDQIVKRANDKEDIEDRREELEKVFYDNILNIVKGNKK